jgi:hypothetical protein
MEPEELVFLKIEIVLLFSFATTKSGLPSPSTSPAATLVGLDPVVKSTFEAKELAVMEPEVLVFLKTETELLLLFATVKSGFPSSSTSLTATLYGLAPVVKSTFEAKELDVMEPEVLVFLKTEIVLLPQFATVKSGLPSPSTSLTAILIGVSPVVKSTFGAKELDVIEPEVLVFLKTETVLLP